MKRITTIITVVILMLAYACNDDEQTKPKQTIGGNTVKSIYIDDNGIKWFGTENGISCYNGENWKTYTTDDNLACNTVNDIAFQMGYSGPEIWIATDDGASVFAIELDAVTSATSYTSANSGLVGDTVRAVAIDTADNRWFGTNGGVAVFAGQAWDAKDNGGTLTKNPVQDVGTGPDGYSFIASRGAGVAVMRYVDAISTVTYYEQPWSPMPSMNVFAVYVDNEGTQWYGTDAGVAKHSSVEAKRDWYLYFKQDGLIDDMVISIAGDNNETVWFGTTAGVSRFDGTNWSSYTTDNGLAGNTVYAIAVDTDGTVWFGTNNGASHFNGTTWTTYRKD